MPFGNSLAFASDDFELQRTFNGFGLKESRPRFELLTDGAQTTARPPDRRQAAAHEVVAAPDDPRSLPRVDHIPESAAAEPHAADAGHGPAKANAQHRPAPRCRTRPLY